MAEELPYILKVDSPNPTVTATTGMGGGVWELVRVGRAGVAGVVEDHKRVGGREKILGTRGIGDSGDSGDWGF